jgi:branched-chain amino acid transport system permease protein
MIALTDMTEALVMLIAALGLAVVVRDAGLPSLGQGAFMGAGAYADAILRVRGHWDPLTAVAGAVVIGALAGLLVARGVARLRPPFVAASTWLAAWTLTIAIGAFPWLTGGARGLVLPPPVESLHVLGIRFTMGPPAWFVLAVVMVVATAGALTLASARVGPALAVMRTDPAAARALGLGVERRRAGAIVASGALAALAGALLVSARGVADPTVYGPLLSLKLFLVVVAGTAVVGANDVVLGPAIGLVALAAVGRLASLVGGSRYEPILGGAVLLVAVLIPRVGTRRSAPPTGHARLALGRGATLVVRGVTVRYGPLDVLDRVDLELEVGSCTAVIGANGSGKTTLLRALAGVTPIERGTILLDGIDLAPHDAESRRRLGVARTLQRAALVPGVDLRSQVVAAGEMSRTTGVLRAVLATPKARADQRATRDQAEAILGLVGLEARAGVDAGELTAGEVRLAQLAQALMSGARVLLLDEPAAGMDSRERRHLREIITVLRSHALTIVIVEHDLVFIADVADRVVRLESGRIAEEVRG